MIVDVCSIENSAAIVPIGCGSEPKFEASPLHTTVFGHWSSAM
jgi:hypothetical protein